MSDWLTHHVQALRLVISRFKQNIFSTLLISLAIGVSLALPVIMYLALDSVGGLVSTVKKESHISVFLRSGQSDAILDQIKKSLSENDAIKSFQFVSKEDALAQLTSANNNKNLINSLDENPLPDAFFIEPNSLDKGAISTLENQLGAIEGVEKVQIDDAWLSRLGSLLALGEKAMFILAVLLSLALFAVIGNTIRMQVLTQHEEIEVSQLIGATKSFIRRPFLYSGAFYGLIGGILALIIASIVIMLFNQSLATLMVEYQTDFSLNFPSSNVLLLTCIAAIAIGLISAYLAVSKSLSKSFN